MPIALYILLSNHVRFPSLCSGIKSSSTAEYVVWDILFNECVRPNLLIGCIWALYVTRQQCLKYVAKEEVHARIIHSNVLLWNVLYLDVRKYNLICIINIDTGKKTIII